MYIIDEICSFKNVRINGFGYCYNLNACSMKTNQETLKGSWLLLLAFFLPLMLHGQAVPADTSYLADVKDEMRKIWPESRTINLVFHGHSVPAGYWTNHEVHTLESYPHLVLKKLKEKFPAMRVERIDERFTSQIAQRAMLEGGLKKKDRQNKETVDMITAVLILQSWLEMNE